MKKLHLFIIPCLFLFAKAEAQDFLSVNKLWSTTSFGTENGYPYESRFIKLSGDTLIGSIGYSKVLVSEDSLQQRWETYGYIRETDTSSVYIVTDPQSGERLLYDFGIQEGDSISIDNSDSRMFVDSIRIKAFGTNNEMRSHYYLSGEGSAGEVWIEGVGSIHGLLFEPYETMLLGEGSDLVCFYENNSLVYHNEKYGSCFVRRITGIPEKAYGINICYMGANSILFRFQEYPSQDRIFELFDLQGRKVYSQTPEGEQLLFSGEGFPAGIYLFRYTSGRYAESGKLLMR